MQGRKWAWGGLAGLALAYLGGWSAAQPPSVPEVKSGTPPATAPAGVIPVAPAPAPAGVAQAAAPAQPAAVVNGVPISLAELDATIKMGGPTPVQLSEAVRRQRQIEVLGLMIDHLLMHQFLEKSTPPIAPKEVKDKLAEMEMGLKKQGKSLAEFCHDTNQTLAQLEESIADYLRWSAYATSQINDASLAKYYKENKDFFDNTTVQASHIVLRVPTGLPPSEKEKVRAKLLDLKAQIEAGKLDFAAAAKAHSQDPRASQGGDLGFFPRKWVFDEAFSRAAFALKKGQISDVVETDYGLHLILCTDRKEGTPSDFTKIREAVREFCMEDMRQTLLSDLRKKADVKINLP
jgi:peptidyl-prolyl cis-trans isomerase C